MGLDYDLDDINLDKKKLLQKCIDDEINTISRGYIAELEWQEKMSKHHYQVKCDRCDKYHIWKKKE